MLPYWESKQNILEVYPQALGWGYELLVKTSALTEAKYSLPTFRVADEKLVAYRFLFRASVEAGTVSFSPFSRIYQAQVGGQ
jgi:hypothetical protein